MLGSQGVVKCMAVLGSQGIVVKCMAIFVPTGCVRFARYCCRMHSRHILFYDQLTIACTKKHSFEYYLLGSFDLSSG